MWRLFRKATSGLTALLLVGMAGCVDLEVQNPNAPDAERALQNAEDVEALIGGAFSSWHEVLWYGNGPSMLVSEVILPRDRFADAAYRNPGFEQNWLALEFRGERSNHFGVGTVVTATVESDGTERKISRVVGATGSFGSNPTRLHLGLGGAGRVRRLEVFWPATGETQSFRNVEANQRLLVTEQSDALLPLQVGIAAAEEPTGRPAER